MSWDANNGSNNDSWGAPAASSGGGGWDAKPSWDSGNDSAPAATGGWDSGNAAPAASGGWDSGNAAPAAEQPAWDSGNATGGDSFNAGGDNFNSGGGDYNSGGDGGYGGGGGGNHAPREGDWDCPSCSASNFARRTECFKCGTANPNPDAAAQRPRGEITEEMKAHRDYKWASNRARYEFNENAVDENGMGRRDEELENELFEANSADQQTTLDFSKYEKIPVRVERGAAPQPIKTFDEANLNPAMKENVKLARYSNPTPVQTYSIPIVTSGKDLMACAQTGSGKTAAFLIPTLSALFTSAKDLQKPRPAPYEYRTYKAEPLVLIIAPTRELCSQIFDECRRFTYRSCLRPCAVYGGADSIGQIRQLERGCDVLAAAPGRLMDFIERGKIGLNRVKYLILDEADRMLDMGFEAIIRQLVQKKGMPVDRQTLMFSATFPRAIRALARDFLKPDYLFLKVGRVGGTSDSITQKVMYVEEDEKREALRTLLNSQPPSRTLIFVETKRSADSLDQYLYERSFPSTSIHGDRTQMEREDALLAFKSGQCPILVATAVAARGIDIRNVMHVINYDMPNDMDEYIHRIGRTARVGKSGLATSFYNDRSEGIAPELTKLLKECNQPIPDFLSQYVTDDITFDEDLDDQGVEAPSYAGQEYVPMERNVPGAPQGFNNAPATGAADGAWDAGENSTTPGWENSGGDGGYGGGGGNHAPREGDWNCPSCSASNFARRTECFKCGTAGGNGGSAPRDGEWNCPDCGVNNFSRRTECFKCNTARPEGMGGGDGGRGPRPRRDGDWDCPSCSAVNYAFRDTCFKCQASKDGAADGGYGGDSSYGQSTYDSSAAAGGSSDWNSSSATAGWGSSEPAAPAATESTGGWGSSEPAAPAPAAGGWGEPAAAQSSPAPAAGGWGEPAAAQSSPAPAAGGWGEPAKQSSPAPAAGGWGEPAAAQSSPAPAAGGWGEPAKQSSPAPAAGGWGEPAAQSSPAPAANGWGASAAPAQTPSPAPQQSSPAPAAGGWGAPAAAPAQAPSPAPQQSSPAPAAGGWGEPAKQSSPVVNAPAPGGWGDAPANPIAAGGWGDAPAAPTGNGWN